MRSLDVASSFFNFAFLIFNFYLASGSNQASRQIW